MKVEEAERIHEASLLLLDEIGIRLEHDGIVQRLLSLGARAGSGPHDRRELFSPRLLNRWPRNACPGPLHEVAAARARELLATPAVPALTEDERRALLAVERSFAGE